MKERPILFSTPMVQAILAGRKTMTRRIVKPQPLKCNHESYLSADWNNEPTKWINSSTDNDYWYCKYCGNGVYPPHYRGIKCPYGKVGDVLWVRETFDMNNHGQVAYKADGIEAYEDADGWVWVWEPKWKPSIHMPKSAARIWVEITGIRVERLFDITEADAIAEGIQPLLASRSQLASHGRLYKHYTEHNDGIFGTGLRPVASFNTLWESINGPESWQQNPWVWVVSFKVLSTTGEEG